MVKTDKNRRLPDWLRKKFISRDNYDITKMIHNKKIHTVCEAAKCPNISECYKKPTATFMILGDICTRACKFCNVKSGKPSFIDPNEPLMVAEAVYEMKLNHVVITSVDRDDLDDLGVSQFIKTVEAIVKKSGKDITIEILTPDFQGRTDILKQLLDKPFHIFNHNLETVPRLYNTITPAANYQQSLDVLKYMKERGKITKTGIMVGLGETDQEIYELIEDVAKYKVDALTIGQYLRPSKKNIEVDRYVKPEMFERYKKFAESIGIKYVASSPYVRSSYNAEEFMNSLKG